MKEIIPMAECHLEQIWKIEQLAHSHPWKESMVRSLSGRGILHHVLLVDGQIMGYFYAQNIVGEVSLLNIAIHPKSQGKGLGKYLLQGLISISESLDAESIWLEVRASNQAAMHLYQSSGFNEIDRRYGYYPAHNGREDAIVMTYIV